jgi:hypothetical protein
MDEAWLTAIGDDLYDTQDRTFRILLCGADKSAGPQPVAVLADYSDLVVGDGAGANRLMEAHYLPDVACAKPGDLDPRNLKEFLDANVEMAGGIDGLSYCRALAAAPEAFLRAHGQSIALGEWRDKRARARECGEAFSMEVVATGYAPDDMPAGAEKRAYGWRLGL